MPGVKNNVVGDAKVPSQQGSLVSTPDNMDGMAGFVVANTDVDVQHTEDIKGFTGDGFCCSDRGCKLGLSERWNCITEGFTD